MGISELDAFDIDEFFQSLKRREEVSRKDKGLSLCGDYYRLMVAAA